MYHDGQRDKIIPLAVGNRTSQLPRGKTPLPTTAEYFLLVLTDQDIAIALKHTETSEGPNIFFNPLPPGNFFLLGF